MLIMPCFLAIAVIAVVSAIEIMGFEMLSKKIAFVLESITDSKDAILSMSNVLASMPKRFSVCVKSVCVPP